MASDYQMLRRGITSVGDYAKLEEEFKAKKRAALQQEQMNAQEMELSRQLSDAKVSDMARGGNLPATIQIANEIQKAIAEGDMPRANLLHQVHKTLDKGILPYDAGQPLQPALGGQMQDPMAASRAAIQKRNLEGIQNQNQTIPQAPLNMSQYAPNAMPGYAEAVGGIAATKKGMETQAQKDVELLMDPQIEREKQKASVEGKGKGESVLAYKDFMAAVPALEQTAEKLYKLSDTATYTKTGQAKNFFVREFGFDPGDSAAARAELENTVRVEILPTLKATFGAQFTVKEGEWLLSTLGDVNLSPREKKAALDARVRGWINMSEILASRADEQAPTGIFEGGEYEQRTKKTNQDTLQIEMNLRKKGYSKEQINEYMKARGYK